MKPTLEDVATIDLRARCTAAVNSGARFQMAYAWYPDRGRVPEIRYLVHCGGDRPLEIWRCQPGSQSVPSLAPIAPLLSWYEREMIDLSGYASMGTLSPTRWRSYRARRRPCRRCGLTPLRC